VEAYGTVDELIMVSLLRDFRKKKQRPLIYIQDQLLRCAAALDGYQENGKISPTEESIRYENEIDFRSQPSLRNFIFPEASGCILLSYSQMCLRRTKRSVVRLNMMKNSIVIKFSTVSPIFLFYPGISLEVDNQEIRWPL
jgi:cob(I)alamin adenosyltransferase